MVTGVLVALWSEFTVHYAVSVVKVDDVCVCENENYEGLLSAGMFDWDLLLYLDLLQDPESILLFHVCSRR